MPLTMVQKEANLETVIRISIRLAPSSTTQPRADRTRLLSPREDSAELATAGPTAKDDKSVHCMLLPSSLKRDQ